MKQGVSVQRLHQKMKLEDGAVQQAIVGFHQDEFGDWVADLKCGHGQHVRHQPPMTNRPWVLTEEGRNRHLGESLNCKKCEEQVV